MPPKKEPAKAAAAEPPPADEDEKEIVERDLVIGSLKTKVTRYTKKKGELENENAKLGLELSEQKQNLRDINDFLTNELKAKEINITLIEKKLAELENESEEEKATLTSLMRETKATVTQRVAELEAELYARDQRLKEFEEYAERKAFLEEKLLSLQAALDGTRKASEEKVNDLERRSVQEKDRLKKEMMLRIKQTKDSMMTLTQNQLDTTTKRTIIENEQMSSELAYQCRQTEKIMARNLALVDEVASLKRANELLSSQDEEMAKRSTLYQKTIQTMMAKVKDAEGVAERQARQMAALDARERESQMRTGALEAAAAKADRDMATLREKLTRAFRSTAEQRQEVADFLVLCLEDVKQRIVTVVHAGADGAGGAAEGDVTVQPGGLDELSLEQRERAVRYLLESLQGSRGATADGRVPPGGGLGLGGALGGLGSVPLLPPIGEKGGSAGSAGGAAADGLAALLDSRAGGRSGVHVATQTRYVPVVADLWSAMGLEPVEGPIGADVRPWGPPAKLHRALPQQRLQAATFLKGRAKERESMAESGGPMMASMPGAPRGGF